MAFCQDAGKAASTWLKSRKPCVSGGPVQPSCQSIPVALSTCTPILVLSSCFGWVPVMKISSTVLVVKGPGFWPLQASTLAWTMPSGSFQSLIGQPLVTSVRKPCQTYVGASKEKILPSGVPSLLPFHTPTTREGYLSGSLDGAMKPYAPRSLAASLVPVFKVAGRRLPSERIWNLPHAGFTFGFVLPFRMSVMM